MNTKNTLISLTIAFTILLASSGAAFAQTLTDDTPGRGTGIAIDASLDDYMIPAVAEALGMSEADVAAQYEAGATFTSIALAQGVPADEVFDLYDSVRAKAIELAVADGALTAEEAAWLQSVQQGGNARGGAAMTGNRGLGLSTCDGTCDYDGVPQYLNQRVGSAYGSGMGSAGRGGRR